MRVAPVGVVTSESFDLGCRAAAITHGHPTGWLAAGAFAQIVSDVTTGRALRDAVEAAVWRCGSTPGGEETAGALRGALGLVDLERTPSPQQIELLGGGWVAEEALAISVYCALGTPDSAHALRAAVNHSGDSDSTGSITGSILGATLGGVEWIDADLLQQLEGRAEIEQVAHDLCDAFDPDADRDPDWDRYPPW